MITLFRLACHRPQRPVCNVSRSSSLQMTNAWFRVSSSCRYASTTNSSVSTNPEEPAKPKPKQTTPLRRSASESLPIRTGRRSEIRPVLTLSTAERYSFARLRAHPGLPPLSQKLHDSWWIPKWGPQNREGEVFVFANGTYVCWGLEDSDALRFKREVLDKAPGFEIGVLKEFETEELEFISDPSQKTRLQGDLIVLGQPVQISEDDTTPKTIPPSAFSQDTLLSRYAFSQALARSTALSALEVAFEGYLSSMASLPRSLQETGRPGMSRKALIKKLGELMKYRQGLNLDREQNFSDVPDFYWSEPGLEQLFHSLSNALEVKARTTSLNDKIDYAAELQSTLRAILTETSSHRMELIIIYLIAVEVCIALIRDGPHMWQLIAAN